MEVFALLCLLRGYDQNWIGQLFAFGMVTLMSAADVGVTWWTRGSSSCDVLGSGSIQCDD
ncbi:hypothetical protein Dimus_022420 [Dionaea muscipula]